MEINKPTFSLSELRQKSRDRINTMRLLLICGDGREARVIQTALKKFGYSIDLAKNPHDAEKMAEQCDYDAILAKEIESAPFSTIKVTRRLRNADIGEPVLIIPEDNEEETVTQAFDAGADQVMDPDHSFKELISRIRGLLRQCVPVPGDTLSYLDIEMDLPRLRVTRAGTPLSLIGKPFSLLEFLLRNPEKLHSRENIGRSVWDQNFDPFSNVIDVTVSKLRQQLDKPFEVPYLHTVIGSGYMLSKEPPGRGSWG